jgi:hypothetical protein
MYFSASLLSLFFQPSVCGCLTLEELIKYTGAKQNVLLVTLTRLHHRGLIYRKWVISAEEDLENIV